MSVVISHKTSSLDYDFFMIFLLNISVNIYDISMKYS